MVYTVLRQRHTKEAVHLEEQLEREREAARRATQAEIEEKRQRDRETLLRAFEQVCCHGDVRLSHRTKEKKLSKAVGCGGLDEENHGKTCFWSENCIYWFSDD